MRDLYIALTRYVGLRPDQMPDGIEPGLGPGVNEGVELGVAIERDAEGIRLEQPVKLGIDADHGGGLVIIGEGRCCCLYPSIVVFADPCKMPENIQQAGNEIGRTTRA